ncbi:glutathione S-transferase family protein [Chondromyces crocatus]|uniref:Glutathione S-transferase n=1 Tax=Chondromyces crocatus TaxID=52 RepID=A0A0K1EDE5_CHOCO|nr:glutathione S-transferase family protein [Chondromyces crocatus]AKT38578.1 glutathione S-transferase [Chondromyces crocatus]
MSLPRLITIPFSHYCEKARWALEYAGVAFTEEAYLPPFHAPVSLRAGGTRQVPLLIEDDGVFPDSTAIMQWASRKATPERGLYGDTEAERREIEAFEAQLDKDLGPHTRRLVYFHLLRNTGLLMKLASPGAQPWQLVSFTVMLPLLRVVLRKSLDITPASTERSLTKIGTTFARVGERLLDGRPFLVGTRLSAADLTFASLAAPVLFPSRYGARLPSVDALPSELRARVQAWREHPAGRWALGIYEQYRNT